MPIIILIYVFRNIAGRASSTNTSDQKSKWKTVQERIRPMIKHLEKLIENTKQEFDVFMYRLRGKND